MLPLATSTWDDREQAAMARVIESGMFSMGHEVATFEKRFAEFVGSRFCVMVNSGSSANLLAIASLFHRSEGSLKPGDEVIVPAVSWSTTYAPLQQYGLHLKFVDVDRDTMNFDLEALQSAISERTRLIVAVNLLGNPNDFAVIQSLIADRDIFLFEDNCESLAAEYGSKQAGTFGILGSYSTFFSHHISTMEGGMVVTDDEELYHIMLSIRSHGWTRHLPEKNHVCEKGGDPFYESFRFVLPGYNLRPLELSGALGQEQLIKLPDLVRGRRSNAEKFHELFTTLKGCSIQREIGRSSWFGFAILIEKGREERDRVVSALQKNGIECRPIVGGNFTRNPVIEYFDYSIHDSLKNADAIHDLGFFIGNHHYDISESLVSLADQLETLLK